MESDQKDISLEALNKKLLASYLHIENFKNPEDRSSPSLLPSSLSTLPPLPPIPPALPATSASYSPHLLDTIAEPEIFYSEPPAPPTIGDSVKTPDIMFQDSEMYKQMRRRAQCLEQRIRRLKQKLAIYETAEVEEQDFELLQEEKTTAQCEEEMGGAVWELVESAGKLNYIPMIRKNILIECFYNLQVCSLPKKMVQRCCLLTQASTYKT